jgi:hypothetical protein
VNGEVQDVKPALVELVDHEADDLLPHFGHHADAIPLAEAAKEVLFAPGMSEGVVLNPKDLGHIPTDHPTDVDAEFLAFEQTSAHEHPFHGRSALDGDASGDFQSIDSKRHGQRCGEHRAEGLPLPSFPDSKL